MTRLPYEPFVSVRADELSPIFYALISWQDRCRDADGVYWMGWQFEEHIVWPAEKPTWTQAAATAVAERSIILQRADDKTPLRLQPGTRILTVTVREGVRWVDEGAVLTSAGISAGIDMCLHLVERLHSRELALRTARQMDYDWKDAA
mgnify:CR=1 FL=1